jgi:hypothetical protein
MAVCKIGRETIEHIDGSWGPTERNVHNGTCTPALMTTIELLTGWPVAHTCEWCAWPTEGNAQYLISGRGCCHTHVNRAMREITTMMEAAGVVRGVSIDADRS